MDIQMLENGAPATDCLTCSTCMKAFPSKTKLTKHENFHTESGLFTCILCNKNFTTQANLSRHFETHKTWPRPFACLYKTVQENMTTPTTRNDPESMGYLCTLCLACPPFETLKAVQMHLKKDHSNTKKYHCTQCSKQFASRDLLFDHFKTKHSTSIRYFCNKCQEQFLTTDDRDEHFKNLHHNQFFKCILCKDRFPSVEVLKEHINDPLAHHHPCDVCSKVFPTKLILDNHLYTVHNVKSFTCELCTKNFCSPYRLKYHVSSKHFNQKSYPCTSCSKKFDQKYSLTRHIQSMHSSKKPFVCPFSQTELLCKAEFTRRDRLKAHVGTHKTCCEGNKMTLRKGPCRECVSKFVKDNKTLEALLFGSNGDTIFQHQYDTRSGAGSGNKQGEG